MAIRQQTGQGLTLGAITSGRPSYRMPVFVWIDQFNFLPILNCKYIGMVDPRVALTNVANTTGSISTCHHPKVSPNMVVNIKPYITK